MSSRIRGQEATVRIKVADEFAAAFGIFGQLAGSFFKVREFTLTPRTDLVEQEYLGEDFDDLDVQHHGFDFSFTIDELDNAAINFLSLIVFKESAKLPPPVISVAVTYIYRETAIVAPTLPHTEELIGCVMKQADRTIGGRKEYIQNSYEGKAKLRQVLVG
jgi:hypothetical protein